MGEACGNVKKYNPLKYSTRGFGSVEPDLHSERSQTSRRAARLAHSSGVGMTRINLPLTSEVGLRAGLNSSVVCLQQQPVAHISTSPRERSDSVKAASSLKKG